MPPVSSEEPRYNGIYHSNLSPGASNGASDSSRDDIQTRTRDNTLSYREGLDPVTQIDPPKGFEPNSDENLSSTSLLNNDRTDNTANDSSISLSQFQRFHLGDSSRIRPCDSLGSVDVHMNHTKLSEDHIQIEGDDLPRLNGTLSELEALEGVETIDAQSGDNNLVNQIQTQGDDATRLNGSMSSQELSISSLNTPTTSTSTHPVHSNNVKEIQPTPSTSSQRIMSSLNTIVTKLTKAFTNSLNTDRCLQEEMPKFAFSHKRSREKTWKLMDKVVSRCQDSRMNLPNAPPYILELLPETFKHLKLIHAKYDSSLNYPEDDNGYSQVFLRNLQNRCKQTLKLFKDAKEEMFDEESDYRHKLTRHTLVFNHILSELKAIFPEGQFIGEKYLITKKETAGEFWKSSFGSSVLVDWKTFYHALQQVHKIDSSFFSLHALKQTIDLTCDDYISIFEFDVFTRLFQPWSTLLRNWQILAVTHPGYKAFLTYGELKARLEKLIDKPGSYVFRLSCTRLGQWAIGYVTQDKQILQTIVQNISLSQALTETKFYLYPDGKDEDPSLSVLCSGMAGDERNVTVTEEQYEIYCGVGNSFQTCKICFENDKDVRVEPCNHLLCTSCLLAWQESEGHGCPYCRTEIKETVQITMDLPKTNH